MGMGMGLTRTSGTRLIFLLTITDGETTYTITLEYDGADYALTVK